MPFNGSGTFQRIYSWVVDAANNVNISSSRTDAEMNGFAAGLTNCITRDGQSPPSADIPWGGKRLMNIAVAIAGTDALSQNAADARYVQLTGSANLTLTGTLTAATLSISGNGTVGGTLGVTGATTLSSTLSVSGATTLAALTASGLITGNGGFSGTTLSLSGLSTVAAYVANGQTLVSSNAVPVGFSHSRVGQVGYHLYNGGAVREWLMYQPAHATDDFLHFSSVVAGGITDLLVLAPTGLTILQALSIGNGLNVSGALTTGTGANCVGYLGAPQNLQTASYQLALSDIGKSVDMNVASGTLTIPANASVAFPVGAVIVGTNLNASALTIAITTDTLTMSGTTTTGPRTIGQNGEFRLIKKTATSWLISGTAMS